MNSTGGILGDIQFPRQFDHARPGFLTRRHRAAQLWGGLTWLRPIGPASARRGLGGATLKLAIILHRVLVSHKIDFVESKERLGEGTRDTRQATHSIVRVFLEPQTYGRGSA